MLSVRSITERHYAVVHYELYEVLLPFETQPPYMDLFLLGEADIYVDFQLQVDM